MKVVSTICGLLSLFAAFACHNPKRAPASDLSPPSAPTTPITQQKQAKPGEGGTVSGRPTGEWNRVDTGEVFHFTSNAMVSTKEGKQAFDRIEEGSVIYGSGSFKVVPSPDNKILDVSHGSEEFYLIRSGIDDAEVQGAIALAASGFSLAGDTRIAIISDISLRNLSEDTTVISGKPSVDGTFAIQNVQSGSYSVVANTTDGTKIAVIDDLRVERKKQKAGNISTPRTAHNFKTMISLGADIIYEGTQYSGTIRVKNIGTAMVPGANYSIAVPGNLIVTSKARDILGSINAGATKEIPFNFKAIGIDDDQVDIEVPITITDTSNNKWLDYVYLTVFKQPFSTYITANRKSVSGFISYLDNKLVHFTVPAGKTSSVEVPYVYGQPYHVVLSAPDLTAETEYSIGIGKTPGSDFSSFRDTGAFEPNNMLAEAHDLSAGEEAKAYLYAGDVDFFRFALTRPTAKLTNIKSGDLVANDFVKVQGTCSDDGGDVTLKLKNAATSTTVKCDGHLFNATLILSRPASGAETIVLQHKNTFGFPSKLEEVTVAVEAPLVFTAFNLNQGNKITNSNDLTVDIVGTNAKDMYIFNGPNCSDGGSWQPFRSLLTWQLAQFNKEVLISAKIRSLAGAISACKQASIVHDNLPPADGSIAISNNISVTKSNSVSLTLNAVDSHGPVMMYITNQAGCNDGGTWEPIVASRSWNIVTMNASNTIYAKFKDGGNYETNCFATTITHDNVPPPPPTLTINSGSIVTNQTAVSLSIMATTDASQMYVTNSSGCTTGGIWEAYNPSRSWNLSQINSNATVYLKVRDNAFNESSCVASSIIHDIVAPIAPTLTINNGLQFTNQTLVDLSITYPADAYQMYVTNISGCNSGGSWENLTSPKTWSIAQTNTMATVYMKVRDRALNESTCFARTVTHDNVAPGDPTLNINSGSTTTNQTSVTLGITSQDAVQIYVSNTAGCTSGGNWEPFSSTKNWTLAQSVGTATVYLKVRDNALNESNCISKTVIFDYLPPIVGNNGIITATAGKQQVTLSWNSASDDYTAYNALQYKSYFAPSNANMSSVADVQYATNFPLASPQSNSVTITGLTGLSTYKFNVIAQDQAGNKSVYQPVTARPSYDLWAWISGSNLTNQLGVYGTKGTPSTVNQPGARSGSVTWKDASGNLWLFGGQGYGNSTTTGYLNDLWKYNSTSETWTWISGSSATNQVSLYGTQWTPSTGNYPGARGSSVSWTDRSGNLWLFGGTGFGSSSISGYLNDLWMFNPTNSTWTWVSGSKTINQTGIYGTKGFASTSYYPGARTGSVSWSDDSGNFWLFGGIGYGNSTTYGTSPTSGYLNDLWKFNPTLLTWTWVSGSSDINQAANYGAKGTSSTTYYPGARYSSVSWIDKSNNLWLFGGFGYDVLTTTTGYLNDLWKLDTTNSTWTWVSGSNTSNKAGTYGTKGTPSIDNAPGARERGVSWTDASGNLWVNGGYGYNASTTKGYLNDLWKYNPTLTTWTWVAGSSSPNLTGSYGTKGVVDNSNSPGSRYFSSSWSDSTGNLWLFGGLGNSASTTSGYLNDLWRFTP